MSIIIIYMCINGGMVFCSCVPENRVIDLSTTGSITIDSDSSKLLLGGGQEGELYYSSSNYIVIDDVGAGAIQIGTGSTDRLGINIDSMADVVDGRLVLPGLMRNQTHQVQRIGMFGTRVENRPVDGRGPIQSTRLVMLNRNRNCFRNGSHNREVPRIVVRVLARLS